MVDVSGDTRSLRTVPERAEPRPASRESEEPMNALLERAQLDPSWTDADIAAIVEDFLDQVDPGYWTAQLEAGSRIWAQLVPPGMKVRRQLDPGDQLNPNLETLAQVDPGDKTSAQLDPGEQIDP